MWEITNTNHTPIYVKIMIPGIILGPQWEKGMVEFDKGVKGTNLFKNILLKNSLTTKTERTVFGIVKYLLQF